MAEVENPHVEKLKRLAVMAAKVGLRGPKGTKIADAILLEVTQVGLEAKNSLGLRDRPYQYMEALVADREPGTLGHALVPRMNEWINAIEAYEGEETSVGERAKARDFLKRVGVIRRKKNVRRKVSREAS